MLQAVPTQPESIRAWSSIEVWLAIALLGFAITVLIFQYLHLKSSETSWSAQAVTRFLGFPLIIFAALFAMVMGYPDHQLAPLYGLLGVIAGYLLGQTSD